MPSKIAYFTGFGKKSYCLDFQNSQKMKIYVGNVSQDTSVYKSVRTTVANFDVLLFLSFFALVIFPTILILWTLENRPFFFQINPPPFEGGSVKSFRLAVYEVLYNYLTFFIAHQLQSFDLKDHFNMTFPSFFIQFKKFPDYLLVKRCFRIRSDGKKLSKRLEQKG